MSGELLDELAEAAIAAGHDCYCGRSPDICEDAGGCPASREIARLAAALEGARAALRDAQGGGR